MTDKKLTDKEIVKALEEHYKQVDKGYSTHLEYGGKGDEHEEKYIYMLRDVLDLINRLQAKNERLKEEIKNLAIVDYFQWEKDLKAEGRNEFVGLLCERFRSYQGLEILFKKDLEDLLKELEEK